MFYQLTVVTVINVYECEINETLFAPRKIIPSKTILITLLNEDKMSDIIVAISL